MKKLILILSVVLLAGCVTAVPVAMKFPDVPKDMLESCPDLKDVQPGTTKLSDVIGVVADNYNTYYDCKDKVDSWVEWYNEQKKIFDSIK